MTVYLNGVAQVVAHEATHVDGGLDDIDSALAIAAMAALATGKIWQGNANRPSEVDLPAGIVSGLIVLWHGTIANIPTGYVICDGNNSTPNLLTKFVEGVATAATNPGTTGGATSKTTAVGGDKRAKSQDVLGADADGGLLDQGSAWFTVNVQTIPDIRPLFYDIAYLMKT